MWRISQGALRRMIRHTAFAAAADDSRPFPHRRLCRSGTGRNPPGRHRLQPAWLSARANSARGQCSPGRVSFRCGPWSELMRILDEDDDADVEFVDHREPGGLSRGGSADDLPGDRGAVSRLPPGAGDRSNRPRLSGRSQPSCSRRSSGYRSSPGGAPRSSGFR